MRLLPWPERSELVDVLAKFRKEFIAVGVFTSLANLLMLSPTLYMLQVYDRVMQSRSELTLIALSLVVLFLYLTLAFCEWMRSKLVIRIGVHLDQALNKRIFRAMFDDSLTWTGRTPSQAMSDLTTVRQWLTGAGVFAFFDLPWTPLYIAVMFLLHPFLGYLSIIFVLILGLLAWFASRLTREELEKAQEEEKELNALIHSKLRNAEVIEAHGMLPGLHKRWWDRQLQTFRLFLRANDVEGRMTVLSKEVRILMQSMALGAGALLVIEEQLGISSMIASTVLMGRVTAPLDSLVSGWKGFIQVRGAFGRINELLAKNPERDSKLVNDALRGELELRNLVATAPGRAQPILKGLSLQLPAGQVYAIMGASGSGKSTLGKALLGVWPHVSGEVRLDGVHVMDWDREVLGPQLGYLPQDVELFRGTVAENIARLGKTDSEAVIEAARQSGMHDTILHFPRGYDTQIGDGGSFLSGGQRQRVGLARALYGSPSLVVLDEPNANLDDVGEAALESAVQSLKARGATVFLITHRPNIINVVDRIILLRDGQVERYGSRDEILAYMKEPSAAPVAQVAASNLRSLPV